MMEVLFSFSLFRHPLSLIINPLSLNIHPLSHIPYSISHNLGMFDHDGFGSLPYQSRVFLILVGSKWIVGPEL